MSAQIRSGERVSTRACLSVAVSALHEMPCRLSVVASVLRRM